jgi:hypothetical protein
MTTPSETPATPLIGPEAIDDLLTRSRRAFLFCRDSGGRLLGYALHVTDHRQGSLFFTTYTKSAKVAHLRDDPRVCCILQDDEGPVLRWCSSEGTVVFIHPNEDEVEELFRSFPPDERLQPEVIRKVQTRLLEGKRIVMRVDLDEPETLVIEERELIDGA